MAKKVEVCYADEIEPGGRKIANVRGRSVGVFNVDNSYYAVLNVCPHKGAPLCRGIIDGHVTGDEPGHYVIERSGEILRCPWHGWEFDLKTGESVFNPHKVWVRNYPVSVESGVDPDSDEEDPGIETFEVTVEQSHGDERPKLFVHL